MKNFVVLLGSILIICPCVAAQEGTWITTTGRSVGTSVTPDEGKKQALDIARAEAIKQVVGVKVSEELFRSVGELIKGRETERYFDTFSKLSRSTAVGRILKEEVRYTVTLENEIPVYTASLRALVMEEKGMPDPAFKVEVTLRNPVLLDRTKPSENDELHFKVNATGDCYLYIFNLLSNDSVQLILPNQYLRNNLFLAGKKEQEFERDIQAMGMRFIVELPKGLSRTKEALYVIALKDNVDLTGTRFDRYESNTSQSYRTAMVDIMNWLLQIPVDRRTEAFQSYEIRRSLE